jgi:hypothetical protein
MCHHLSGPHAMDLLTGWTLQSILSIVFDFIILKLAKLASTKALKREDKLYLTRSPRRQFSGGPFSPAVLPPWGFPHRRLPLLESFSSELFSPRSSLLLGDPVFGDPLFSEQ